MNDSAALRKITEMFVGVPLQDSRTAVARLRRAGEAQAAQNESAALRMVSTEVSSAYLGAVGAYDAWQKARAAADAMMRNAELTTKAYQLGESSLNDVLVARRLALESGLASRNAQLEAQGSRYRLLLDAHLLWPLDIDEGN